MRAIGGLTWNARSRDKRYTAGDTQRAGTNESSIGAIARAGMVSPFDSIITVPDRSVPRAVPCRY
jgi:hypothetical protein